MCTNLLKTGYRLIRKAISIVLAAAIIMATQFTMTPTTTVKAYGATYDYIRQYTESFDNGGIGGWTKMRGSTGASWYYSSNQLYLKEPNVGPLTVIDNYSPNVADGKFKFKVTPIIATRFAGVFRYADASNYAWIGYEGSGNYRVRYVKNGVGNDYFFTGTNLQANTTYTIEIEYTDSRVDFWVNGSRIWYATYSDTMTVNRGKVGFELWSSAEVFIDDLEVKYDPFSEQYSYNFDSGIGGWTRILGNGTVSSSSNQLYINNSADETRVVDNNSPSVANGTLSFMLKHTGNGRTYALFRYADANNYAWVGYEPGGSYRIRAIKNGTGADTMFTGPVLQSGVNYRMEVRFIGEHLTVYIDGVQAYSGMPSYLPTKAGKIGVGVWSIAETYIDNVKLDYQPTHDITNGIITVTVDKTFPQPLIYKLNSNGAVMFGADLKDKPFININGNNYSTFVSSFASGSDYVTYSVEIPTFRTKVDYRFELSGNALVRKITGISGDWAPNVGTLKITTAILSSNDTQSGLYGAWTPETKDVLHHSFTMSDTIGAVAGLSNGVNNTSWPFMYTSNICGSAYSNCIDVPFSIEVGNNYDSHKGIFLYDQNYNFHVKQYLRGEYFESKTYIGGDSNSNGTVDWQDGAIWLRGQLPQVPASLEDAFRNGGNWWQTPIAWQDETGTLGVDSQLINNNIYPRITAAMQQIANQTPASKNYLCSVGWQGKGHDYWWYKLDTYHNPALGGKSVMQSNRDQIVNNYLGDLSFHIDVDMCTANNPDLNDSLLVKDANGNRIVCDPGNGIMPVYYGVDQFADYANGTMYSRIQNFLDNNWKPKIVYCDVMWDKVNVYLGNYGTEQHYAYRKFSDKMSENGVYIATEYYQPSHLRNDLIFVYKGVYGKSNINNFIIAGKTFNQYYKPSTTSSYAGNDEGYDQVFGILSTPSLMGSHWDPYIANFTVENTYMYAMPFSYMRQYNVSEFSEDSSKIQLKWGSSCVAKWDKSTHRYTLTDGDVTVADGDDRFIPSPDGTQKIYVYSKYGSSRTWKIPSSWGTVTTLKRYELTESGKKYIGDLAVTNRDVTVSAVRGIPYVLEVAGTASGGDTNLSRAAVAKASSRSGDTNRLTGYTTGPNGTFSYLYGAAAYNAIDGAAESYWRAYNETNGAWLEVEFPRQTTFNRVILKEGSNSTTSSFRLQYWSGSAWTTCYTGTTIGSALTANFTGVTSNRARIVFDAVTGNPEIKEFETYYVGNNQSQSTFSNKYTYNFNSGLGSWTKVLGNGTVSVVNNELKVIEPIDGQKTRTVDNGSPSAADASYKFRIRQNSAGRFAAIFRYVDLNNYAALIYDGPSTDGSKGVYRIRGVVGGVSTDTVFESTKISNGSTHKVVLEFKGKNAAVWLDDFLISSGVYTQLPTAAGKIGFEVWSVSEAYIDDVELMY